MSVAEPYRFAPDCFEEAEIDDDGSLRLKLTREQAERFWWILDKSLEPTGRLSRGDS